MTERSVAGVGIGLRRELADQLFATERSVDWLEIIPENFLTQGGWRRATLERALERWPVVSHGVCLSVGGPEPLDTDYLEKLRRLLDRLGTPFFSDHACYERAHGLFFNDLLPLPFTQEAALWAARRAREVAERVERPLVLENITYYAEMPTSVLSEGEFLRLLLEESGCGLLLDVNNVYVNAVNHGRAPRDVLFELPLDRVRQIHLAGHEREDDILLDNHGSAVCDEVWALYREVLERVGPKPTLIEWDTNIPPLDRVLDEADRARDILHDVCSGARAGFDPLENRDVAL
ncbi:MAG TPA: DUF692 domain-containing protein [Polyangiaceae bacterium]|jgi:uncharacterized protein (UPF0276 family)